MLPFPYMSIVLMAIGYAYIIKAEKCGYDWLALAARIYSEGLRPVNFLKATAKEFRERNPT